MTWRPRDLGRGRGVAADGDGAGLAAPAQQRLAHQRVRAVGADHDAGAERQPDTTGPVGGRCRSRSTRWRRRTAPAATARSTRRASKTCPGDDVHLPPHRSRDLDVAVRELEVAQRRPVVDDVGGADLGQRVEDVRRDPVTAGLVAREVAAVEQQHAQRRGPRPARRARPRSRPGRRRRPRGPSARAVIGRPPAGAASTRAMPTAATNGSRPDAAHHEHGEAEHDRGGGDGPRPPEERRRRGRRSWRPPARPRRPGRCVGDPGDAGGRAPRWRRRRRGRAAR